MSAFGIFATSLTTVYVLYYAGMLGHDLYFQKKGPKAKTETFSVDDVDDGIDTVQEVASVIPPKTAQQLADEEEGQEQAMAAPQSLSEMTTEQLYQKEDKLAQLLEVIDQTKEKTQVVRPLCADVMTEDMLLAAYLEGTILENAPSLSPLKYRQ